MPGRFQLKSLCYLSITAQPWAAQGVLTAPASPFTSTARSERYRHLGSEDDETNDEESSTEIPQFSSCSHRFSKVGLASRNLCSRVRRRVYLVWLVF